MICIMEIPQQPNLIAATPGEGSESPDLSQITSLNKKSNFKPKEGVGLLNSIQEEVLSTREKPESERLPFYLWKLRSTHKPAGYEKSALSG